MNKKKLRKKYLIHPSSQIKYMMVSIVPALLIGVFCTNFLIEQGELILLKEKQKYFQDIQLIEDDVDAAIYDLKNERYTPDSVEAVRGLLRQIISMKNSFPRSHY